MVNTCDMYSSLWYDSLVKPPLQPPAWIFTPAWIILYGTLFTALILYSLNITSKNKISGYVYFIIHIIFNLLWSPVFFCLHKINIAFIIIFVMIITALLMMFQFFRISKLSGFILFPYFVWLMYAAYLNFELWLLNS